MTTHPSSSFLFSIITVLFITIAIYIETLHNGWLRCITRDTVGGPDSISIKDLMAKTHHLPISVMIKERRLKREDYPGMCNLLDGLVALGCILLRGM